MTAQQKVALVTGVSSGLGHAIARVFAREGASVVGVARREELGLELERQIRDEGGSMRFLRSDVRRVDECQAAVELAISEFGRLDVVVNNAGFVGEPPVQESHTVTEPQWDEVVDTNLKGAFFCCRYALEPMRRQRSGVILNICSLNAVTGPARMAAYSSSKAGLVQLSRTLAVEYVDEGIRINAIVLGGVDSPSAGICQDAYARYILPDGTPLPPREVRSPGQPPEDVAAALWHLCDDKAQLITGATIAIDQAATAGGMASTLIYMTSAGLWQAP